MSYQLYRDADCILTMSSALKKKGRHVLREDLSILKKYSLVVNAKGFIEWMGPLSKIPKSIKAKVNKEVSLKGQSVLPGFVECHTHTIFAGHRADEFEMRNQGVSYQEIAAKGGGILSTMKKTRDEPFAKMLKQTQKKVDQFVEQGVTTLEIKSGYALDLKNEIKMLQVAKELKGPKIVSTYLGAHALPPEFKNQKKYFAWMLKEVLPKIKIQKLCRRVDIFIEQNFFHGEDALFFLRECQNMGFDLVLHSDQLTLSGGTEMAIDLCARSADHIIQIDDKVVRKLSQSEVTGVLLPLADLYMKCAYPPARKIIDAGARVALATDFNPGTCPSQDLAMVGVLARLEMKMTLPEVIGAYTVGAAYALGLDNEVGSLTVGRRADFVTIESDWEELFYHVGNMGIKKVFQGGKRLLGK